MQTVQDESSELFVSTVYPLQGVYYLRQECRHGPSLCKRCTRKNVRLKNIDFEWTCRNETENRRQRTRIGLTSSAIWIFPIVNAWFVSSSKIRFKI